MAVAHIDPHKTEFARSLEDVLDVSRIISGKVRLNIKAVDLSSVVRDAIESLAPAVEAKRLRLHTTLDPRAAPISGDPDRLQQIVWNLVSNAVKFTPQGGRIHACLERVRSHVEFTVTDTGVGIKPEILPYVFDRFRQGDSGPSRQFGGLGLGLAIVRHLVELHGGSVHARSGVEGQGATVRVRLPLMNVRPDPAIGERRA